jgi:glycosyltransferase involved in cell wall biosynthesis
VDLITFRQAGEEDPRLAIPRGLVRDVFVIELPHHRRSFPARLWRNLGRVVRGAPPLIDRFAGFQHLMARFLKGRRYDLGVIEHFWCAPYVDEIERRSAQVVLNLHNIESELHLRCADAEAALSSLAHRAFHRASLELERNWLPRFSLLLAASEEDAALVRKIVPGGRVVLYPNAIPLAPLPERCDENVVVFSGNLEYHPNISAVRFFRRRIWPALREEWPALVWRLIGKNPHAVSRYTSGDPRIDVRGPVEDAVKELARARVAVVPLLAGSGTRLKILEAWAAGAPVVSTSIGAQGLPARHGENIFIADAASAFSKAVSALLHSAGLRHRLSAAGRSLLEKQFTWEAAWRKLDF